MGGCKEHGAKLFLVVSSNKRQWAQTETLEITPEHKKTFFFTASVGKHWSSLPREVLESPSQPLICIQSPTGHGLVDNA